MPRFGFEDERLQKDLIAELSGCALLYQVEKGGTVCFREEDRVEITDYFHRVRDKCFRWYFKWFIASDGESTAESEAEFEAALKAKNLPFFVEYHDSGKVYLLPKADQQLHDELML